MPGLNFQGSFTKVSHKGPYDAIDPTQPAVSAAGKTVLITAGHTGIGFVIAQNFAAAGASHIVLLARRVEVLEKSAKELSTTFPNTKIHYFAASLTDHAKIKDTLARIRSEISPNIDVLVTSAAYAAPPAAAIDLPQEELKSSFDTNVFGNINLVREFLAGSGESSGREKVILDLSTVAAHIPLPTMAAYGVSKLTFTQWLAHVQQDMAGKGLRVHSFHPGSIFTDAAKGFGMTEDSIPWDDIQLPGRFAVWLASGDAAFLKGRFVWATWDVRELVERKGELESDTELLTIGLQGNPSAGQ
ncbi:Serine 3-dehydrogenase [Hyphodiscus hymeniophilus]|uniref:Serine 3-dehydrogenase n=1 Tax=Hyphodiscus hymeniophilus TaxID=353542 RepID=A0A9P7AWX5_9HELO|nr:Serine 3-dehydrogenase [Hyphodiscus hymeniophilus]